MAMIFRVLGQLVLLTLEMTRCFFSHRPEMGAWIVQAYHLGVRSLTIATIPAVFTGMVLALQSSFALSSFGSELYVSDLVSVSIVRELGPVLTSLLVGGRVGSGIAAELGTMKVTQQLDAMRAMATNPVQKLVIPRVLSFTICLPALTIISSLMGILGGLALSAIELNLDGHYFLSHAIQALSVGDIISGVGKTFFFGFFIAIIACNNGMRVEGGADGVGHATTETAVTAAIMILISDFFLTKMFSVFGA